MSHQNYLPTVQPDYLEETLTLRVTSKLDFSSKKNQSIYRTDGGSKEASTLSRNNTIGISLDMKNLSKENADILLDLYLNLNKANGLHNSFIYKHSSEDEYYVCKFMNSISESLPRDFRRSFGTLSVLALGIDRNLIDTSIWVSGETPSEEYIPSNTFESVVFGGEAVTFGGESTVW